MTPPVALTIAGSDSGGGAGIQADLRTFAAFGVHGCSAVAALTAQSTVEVRDVLVTPAPFVVAQVSTVLDDLTVDAVKTGMLATAENVAAVADLAADRHLPNLVVDPVMVSSTGARLLDPDAERAYLERLFPLATVVTPNAAEAGVLLGREVTTVDDQRAAAAALGSEFGPAFVIVKGGDRAGEDAVDVVWHDGELSELTSAFVDTPNTHGTGCSFASAIAAQLATGTPPMLAIPAAKAYVHAALERAAGWRLGGGHGPIDHLDLTSRTKPGSTP